VLTLTECAGFAAVARVERAIIKRVASFKGISSVFEVESSVRPRGRPEGGSRRFRGSSQWRGWTASRCVCMPA
jgi:hypothetical protein